MNALAVSIAVILFPGLIATAICDQIATHSPRWRTFKYTVYSFIFGVSCYIVLQFLEWVPILISNVLHDLHQPFVQLRVWSIAYAQRADVDLWEVLWASAIAPLVAGVATAIDTRKLLTRLARRLRVSNKFGDENLFSYYLNSEDVRWVYIRDPHVNQTYVGNVRDFSEADHIQEIVLSDVTVYNYESSERLYSLPTIYLARPIGTFTIEAVPPEPIQEVSYVKKAAE
jgi:hypothetical protein